MWRFPGYGWSWNYSCRPTPQPQQHQSRSTSATYTTAEDNARSLSHWARPGIEPASLWILVRFLSAETQQELHLYCMNFALSTFIFFYKDFKDKKEKFLDFGLFFSMVFFFFFLHLFGNIGCLRLKNVITLFEVNSSGWFYHKVTSGNEEGICAPWSVFPRNQEQWQHSQVLGGKRN